MFLREVPMRTTFEGGSDLREPEERAPLASAGF
jgi:hypothetical protein